MAHAERQITIDAPIDRVFDVVRDYERYPEFLPETRDVRVLSRHDGIVVVRFELQLIMRFAYTLRLVEEAPRSVLWSLSEATIMKQNDGAWRLETVSEGQTLAVYSLDVTLAGMIPRTVRDRLLGRSLSETLFRFRQRSEQLQGVPSVP